MPLGKLVSKLVILKGKREVEVPAKRTISNNRNAQLPTSLKERDVRVFDID